MPRNTNRQAPKTPGLTSQEEDPRTMTDNPTNALTAEEAAKRVGMTLVHFRNTMTKLNNSGQDLRTPAQPGERGRKYDAAKLDAWKATGAKVPKTNLSIPKAQPGAREIAATATRKGNHWIVDLPEIHLGTKTENLRNANRLAHALAVEKLGVAADELTVKLTIEIPADAAEMWEQAKAQEKEAREATMRAAQLSRKAVHQLKAQGCTYQDIGDILGITAQRAQQLAR